MWAYIFEHFSGGIFLDHLEINKKPRKSYSDSLFYHIACSNFDAFLFSQDGQWLMIQIFK